MSELERIPGTGNEGRVTKKDILQYVESKRSGKSSAAATINVPARSENVPTTQSSPDPGQLQTIYSGNVEIIEMDRMRKLIADHMVRSKQTSPHVTSFTESDVTHLVLWRDRVRRARSAPARDRYPPPEEDQSVGSVNRCFPTVDVTPAPVIKG